MADDARLHLDVALELDASTIHGTIDDGLRPVVEFTGWLELMSAFDTVSARARRTPLDAKSDAGGLA